LLTAVFDARLMRLIKPVIHSFISSCIYRRIFAVSILLSLPPHAGLIKHTSDRAGDCIQGALKRDLISQSNSKIWPRLHLFPACILYKQWHAELLAVHAMAKFTTLETDNLECKDWIICLWKCLLQRDEATWCLTYSLA